MIKWPSRAKSAIRKLFEPLQDIDIYIEDSNDEAFYKTLFGAIVKEKVKIARVFALGGREAVLNAAKVHDHSQRRALFVIDGDLEWVCGIEKPNIVGLHRHEAYCIENFLICEKALSYILSQEIVVTEIDAHKMLMFKDWVASVQEPLLNLFAAFATVKIFAPDEKTVSNGIGVLLTKKSNKKTTLDENKVEIALSKALSVVESEIGKRKAQTTYNKILNRIKKLKNPLDAVSGKDYLLPLLDFRLQEFGCRIRRKSLRMRLATAGDLSRFLSLTNAICQAANGYA